MNIIRVGDNDYFFEKVSLPGKKTSSDRPVDVKISVKDSISASNNYEIVKVAADIISRLSPLRESFFGTGDTEWKIVLKDTSKRQAWHETVPFFRHTYRENTSLEEYEVIRAAGKGSLNSFNLSVDLPQDFTHSSVEEALFDDPFTQLASKDFQQLEKKFVERDNQDFKLDNILILEGNKLSLQPKKYSNPNKNIATVNYYKQFMYNKFGKDKVDYIQFQYQFNFDEMIKNKEPLTAEHVWRMNIGLGNVETHDIKHLSERLQNYLHSDQFQLDKSSTQDLKSFLNDASKIGQYFLPCEAHGLWEVIKNEELKKHKDKALDESQFNIDTITVESFTSWVQTFENQKDISKLDSKQFNQLVSVYEPNEIEIEKMYTGKKVHGNIYGFYSRSEKGTFKPWMDQQELLQTFSQLKNSTLGSYHEQLGHVVAKKHLAHQHPTEGYRVGSLIPAPNDSEGNARWYKVSSCINNGYGILSYTLESACKNDSLPAIKLYRSTASDPYNMDAQASLLNDINGLNSPGYMGTSLADSYEKKFFNDRTIPVWVGYQHRVEQILSQTINSEDTDSIKNQLVKSLHYIKNANEAIVDEIEKKHEAKSLSFLLKRNDHLINKMIYQSKKKIWRTQLLHLANIIHNQTKFDRSDSQTNDIQDAKFIHKLLKKYSFEGLDELKTILESTILNRNYKANCKKNIQNEKNKMAEECINIEKEAEKILAELNENEFKNPKLLQDLKNCLDGWSILVNAYAKQKGETIESKIQEELSFTGHSLGGACGERGLVYFTSDASRIPLPNKKIHLHAFDDPAINKEDNSSFIQFGNKHAELLTDIGSSFNIFRRHEKDDFVITAGEIHLGATLNEQETLKAKQWLTFNAAVQKPTKNAKNRTIRDTNVSHGTQFGTGKKQKGEYAIDNIRKSLIDHEKKVDSTNEIDELITLDTKTHQFKKIIEDAKGDYEITWYDTQVQATFDLGDKGWEAHNELWSSYLSPKSVEKVRSKAGVIIPAYKDRLLGKQTFEGSQDNWKKYTDDKGVFAVNETGVKSQLKK